MFRRKRGENAERYASVLYVYIFVITISYADHQFLGSPLIFWIRPMSVRELFGLHCQCQLAGSSANPVSNSISIYSRATSVARGRSIPRLQLVCNIRESKQKQTRVKEKHGENTRRLCLCDVMWPELAGKEQERERERERENNPAN